MFLVLYGYFSGTDFRVLTFGPYSTRDAAQTYINGQADPTRYEIVAVNTSPPLNAYGPVASSTVSVGQVVVIRYAVANGRTVALAYGPLTGAAADALIAQFLQLDALRDGSAVPGNYARSTVVTGP